MAHKRHGVLHFAQIMRIMSHPCPLCRFVGFCVALCKLFVVGVLLFLFSFVLSCVGDRHQLPAEDKDSVSMTSNDPPQPVQYAVAEFDFTSETSRALSFSAGDTLVLYSQASQDWWRGNKNGDDGLVPASYIKLVNPEELAATSEQSISPYNRRKSEDGIISKLPSFKSNMQMWEQKTLERTNRKAPDPLKDVLNKSKETEVVTPVTVDDSKENLVVDTPV